MKIWQQVLAQQMKPLISPILMILTVLSFLCLLQSGGLKQSHAQLYESCRQARKPSEGFWIETLFQMQKTKALNWLFPENVRRVEKQSTKAGRFLLGYMLKNFQRGPWSLSTPCICQLPSSWPCHGWESSHWLPAVLCISTWTFNHWMPREVLYTL